MHTKLYSVYAKNSRSLVAQFCANLVTFSPHVSPLAPSCLILCYIPHAAFFLPPSPSGPLLLSHVPYHFFLSLIHLPLPCPSLCPPILAYALIPHLTPTILFPCD